MDRRTLVDNMQIFLPLMFKKLVKSYPDFEISKQHLKLLYIIKNEDRKPMSYYSEKMSIPKSNITVMTNKLFEEGLIEREFDPKDRRIILIKLTDKGDEYLCECWDRIKQHMLRKIDVLDNEEVKRLNELIEEMKLIFNKIEESE